MSAPFNNDPTIPFMPKIIQEGFQTLISSIIPTKNEHRKALVNIGEATLCLAENFGCYEFFEAGSYFEGQTAIRGYSDTNYFAVCPEENISNSSSVTLKKFKDALQSSFALIKDISITMSSIQIPFGNIAPESLSITPAVYRGFTQTPYGKQRYFTIPTYKGKWINVSPEAHNNYLTANDIRLGGKLRPLIQLLKAWKYFYTVPISSFYLELLITRYAEKENTIVYDIDFKEILRLLCDINLGSIADPLGISGRVNACSSEAQKRNAFSQVVADLKRAEIAVEIRTEDPAKAASLWNIIFSKRFPAG